MCYFFIFSFSGQSPAKALKSAMSSCHLGVRQESQLSGEDYWEGEEDHSTSQPYPGGAHAQDKPADDTPIAKKKRRYNPNLKSGI